MERTEKRRLDRERHKLEKHNIKEDSNNKLWFSQLPIGKKIFIGKFIEKKTIENDNLIASIMDRCFKSAMDDNLDISVSDMNKIIDDSNNYILDYKEYLEKNGYEEGFNMIENEELKDKAKTKIKQYMAGKMQKAKGLKLLKSEFNLPFTELSDLWADCKTCSTDKKPKEKCESNNIIEKEIAVDNIDIAGADTTSFVLTNNAHVILNSKVQLDESKIKVLASKLKVTNIIREIEGEYGNYIKSNTGVNIGDKIYSDKSVIIDEKTKVINKYESDMNLINEQIIELKSKLSELIEEENKELGKYAELEEVFDL